MPEGAPKPQEKSTKRSSALEAGAFLATFASALNHGPAQALEIDPHTSWIVGVEDTILPSVMQEKMEHATVFVQYAGGSSEWVPPTKGIWNRVTVPLQADARAAVVEGRGREVARMCQIHTHPLATGLRSFKLQKGEPPNPPSPMDIHLAGNSKKGYQAGGVEGADVINAVFDPRGVWYYRQATLTDYTDPQEISFHKELARVQSSKEGSNVNVLEEQINMRALETQLAMETFVYANADAKKIPPSAYKSLEQAYLHGWDAKIRFVSWDKIAQEPACAGPDYDPIKGVMARGRKTLN